jgi:acyl carrier protein
MAGRGLEPAKRDFVPGVGDEQRDLVPRGGRPRPDGGERGLEYGEHGEALWHAATIYGVAMTDRLDGEIRRVLNEAGRLPVDANDLDERADLYAAGMSSHASVNVMLALEETFDIEFPPPMLNRSVFESIASIADAVNELKAQAA